MNTNLRKEVVRQIFNRLGLLLKTEPVAMVGGLDGLLADEMVLDKRIIFVGEDPERQRRVWAASCEIGNEKVFGLVADTSECSSGSFIIPDDIREFTVILRMNTFAPYAIRLSEDADDTGSLSFFATYEQFSRWVEANEAVMAKCLFGVESLAEQLTLKWEKLNDYTEMYGLLIGFLKAEEGEG